MGVSVPPSVAQEHVESRSGQAQPKRVVSARPQRQGTVIASRSAGTGTSLETRRGGSKGQTSKERGTLSTKEHSPSIHPPWDYQTTPRPQSARPATHLQLLSLDGGTATVPDGVVGVQDPFGKTGIDRVPSPADSAAQEGCSRQKIADLGSTASRAVAEGHQSCRFIARPGVLYCGFLSGFSHEEKQTPGTNKTSAGRQAIARSSPPPPPPRATATRTPRVVPQLHPRRQDPQARSRCPGPPVLVSKTQALPSPSLQCAPSGDGLLAEGHATQGSSLSPPPAEQRLRILHQAVHQQDGGSSHVGLRKHARNRETTQRLLPKNGRGAEGNGDDGSSREARRGHQHTGHAALAASHPPIGRGSPGSCGIRLLP